MTVPVSDWRATGERIDALIAAGAAGGTIGRERAEELVRLVADLYGAGLERLLELVHESGGLSDEVLDALAGDDLVAGLLLVHGLHPYDVPTRIERALAAGASGVTLIGIGPDGVARLRVPAGGHGCGSPAPPSVPELERLIEAAAPEIVAIEVEEAVAATAVIPVSALFVRPSTAGTVVGP
jgi:hypothetical protein